MQFCGQNVVKAGKRVAGVVAEAWPARITPGGTAVQSFSPLCATVVQTGAVERGAVVGEY